MRRRGHTAADPHRTSNVTGDREHIGHRAHPQRTHLGHRTTRLSLCTSDIEHPPATASTSDIEHHRSGHTSDIERHRRPRAHRTSCTTGNRTGPSVGSSSHPVHRQPGGTPSPHSRSGHNVRICCPPLPRKSGKGTKRMLLTNPTEQGKRIPDVALCVGVQPVCRVRRTVSRRGRAQPAGSPSTPPFTSQEAPPPDSEVSQEGRRPGERSTWTETPVPRTTLIHWKRGNPTENATLLSALHPLKHSSSNRSDSTPRLRHRFSLDRKPGWPRAETDPPQGT